MVTSAVRVYRTIAAYVAAQTLDHDHVVSAATSAPWCCAGCRQPQPGTRARFFEHDGARCAGRHDYDTRRCLRGPLCPHCAEGQRARAERAAHREQEP